MTDRIYIFTVEEQCFFAILGLVHFLKILQEELLSEITLRMVWRQHQT